jgi:hypothetical protein
VLLFLLVMVPFLFVSVPLALWAAAAGRRRKRRQGLSDAAIRAREWRQWRKMGVVVGLALLTTLAAGLAWLWHDARGLRPEEGYYWGHWYVNAVFAWYVVALLYGGLYGAVCGARRVAGWLRRRRGSANRG